VLLYLLIKYGSKAIEKINGCFAFAFYNLEKNEILLARDRMGINPLMYYLDNEKVIFSSELKGILEFDIPRELDYQAMFTYFQLNYIPNNQCILKKIIKLEPGHFSVINSEGIKTERYYKIPVPDNSSSFISYEEAKNKLHNLLDQSVERRLIADVPVGCFLSGGIDSSVITALAAGHTKNLNTFSIGFTDDPFFDETKYAALVAEKYKTNHTEFKISSDDLLNRIFDIIDYIDEPFADSSALAVNILSSLTQKKATVALSGDGADEMFAGYNKHSAHFNSSYSGTKEKLVTAMNPLWRVMPKSRNSKTMNFIRQLNRFAEGSKLNPADRYWHWASIGSEQYSEGLINYIIDKEKYNSLKSKYLTPTLDFKDINNILYSDMHLVLQGDMLTKVDLMSMANSLEVRTPFLDHTVVDFVFSLPVSYKIDKFRRKKILVDTFKHLLPDELITRGKHGFEVPLLRWFRNELWELIDKKYLSEDFIKQQNLFNYVYVKRLKERLLTKNPEDSHAKIWALLVFQNWWIKYFKH
jgi:asparagine synthase (glutamine-hydrolysing)